MVNLRNLASRLSMADIRRVARAQKLEAKRTRLEAQEKEHLKGAAAAAKRREKIERKLEAVFGKRKPTRKARRLKIKAKRKYSPEALERMAAGARRRWAKHNAAKRAKAARKKSGGKPSAKRPAPAVPATTTA